MPARCAEVVAAIEVGITAPTVAAVPPNVTVAPGWNCAPESATTVPPAVGPLEGSTEESTGGGGGGGGGAT